MPPCFDASAGLQTLGQIGGARSGTGVLRPAGHSVTLTGPSGGGCLKERRRDARWFADGGIVTGLVA